MDSYNRATAPRQQEDLRKINEERKPKFKFTF